MGAGGDGGAPRVARKVAFATLTVGRGGTRRLRPRDDSHTLEERSQSGRSRPRERVRIGVPLVSLLALRGCQPGVKAWRDERGSRGPRARKNHASGD